MNEVRTAVGMEEIEMNKKKERIRKESSSSTVSILCDGIGLPIIFLLHLARCWLCADLDSVSSSTNRVARTTVRSLGNWRPQDDIYRLNQGGNDGIIPLERSVYCTYVCW